MREMRQCSGGIENRHRRRTDLTLELGDSRVTAHARKVRHDVNCRTRHQSVTAFGVVAASRAAADQLRRTYLVPSTQSHTPRRGLCIVDTLATVGRTVRTQQVSSDQPSGMRGSRRRTLTLRTRHVLQACERTLKGQFILLQWVYAACAPCPSTLEALPPVRGRSRTHCLLRRYEPSCRYLDHPQHPPLRT